jgi:hypothetical protein
MANRTRVPGCSAQKIGVEGRDKQNCGLGCGWEAWRGYVRPLHGLESNNNGEIG